MTSTLATDESTVGQGHAGSAERAARGSALNLAGSLTAAVLGLATLALVTNVYGEVGSGVFFTVTALFTVAANGSRFGAEAGLTFAVATLRADGRPAEVGRPIRSALIGVSVVSAVVVVLAFVFAPRLGHLMTAAGSSTTDAIRMIRLLAVAVPAMAITQALAGASRGFGTMRPSVVTAQLARPAAQMLGVATVVIVTDALWPLAIAWSAAITVSAIPLCLWTRSRLARIRPAEVGADVVTSPTSRSDDDIVRRYWRFARPRAAADLLSAGLERLDLLLVAALIGEAGAGLYGASSRLILLGQLLMAATAQSMSPQLAAAFGTGRHDDARHLLRTVTGWSITILWPMFIGLAFGAKTALSVFGPGFEAAAPVVTVLSIGLLTIVALGPGDTLLLMTGDSRASLVNHLVALVIMVGLSVALLPAVGVVGAAVAWAVSRSLLRVLAIWRVWATTGVMSVSSVSVRAALLAALAYGSAGIFASTAVGYGPAAIAVHAVIGFSLHAGLLYRFGGPLELDRLVSAVLPGSTRQLSRTGQLSQS